MITRHTRGKTTWIDLEYPTEEELLSVMSEFQIDERVREEILTPTPYPFTVAFPGYCYLVLHFPTADAVAGAKVQEVDFIVGKNFVITARYEVIDQIHTLHKVLEAEELLSTKQKPFKIEELLSRIMDRMYVGISSEIEQVGYRLDRIERDIFSGKEREAVRTISDTARVLLRFETALARHSAPLSDFLTFLGSPAFFGTKFDEYAAHIEGGRDHAAAMVSAYRSTATELRITNDSLLTSSQDRIIRRLMVFTFVSYPPPLLAVIFAMRTDLPIVGAQNDFLWVVAIMLGSSFFLFLIARFNRWV
ncbi:hypothetical protein KJ819_01870 [Patescibacteria group bacterium]|nr:hypothetical protein [Patescibacteria group bacterium]MBU1500969.1 hypothetical protein [Patescibacteria group bacterium]MBU2080599.1 hypothetical protein [Patescibacteria group bacterium]MBU2124326.1 hypothetical protein [Patescibacteria group bacterium]MBU2194452.1 hypothetical protein [Patescibacteria group bacterium]